MTWRGDRKIKTSAIHLLSPTARSTMRLLLLLAALLAASSFKSYEEETASDEWDKALNMADKNSDEKLEKDELDDIAGQWVYDGPGVRKSLRDGSLETLKIHKADVEQADRNRNGFTSRNEWVAFRTPPKQFEKVHGQKDEDKELQEDQKHALEEKAHRMLDDDHTDEHEQRVRKSIHDEL